MKNSSYLHLSEKVMDRSIVALWVVFVMIWFVPPMVRGSILPHSTAWYFESSLQWLPFWNFSAQMLKEGLFPTWAPHIFCGFPYHGYAAINIYYLPFYLLAHLSYVHAVYLENIVGYSLAGVFAYYALRKLSCSPTAALVGMLASVGGAGYSIYSSYAMATRCFVFAPMAWGMVGISRDRPRFRYVLGMMLGGLWFEDMEAILYVSAFLAITTWFLSPRGDKWKRFFLVSTIIIFYFVFAFWPLINLVAYSSHSLRAYGVTFDYFIKNQQSLNMLILALYPVSKVPGLPFPFQHIYVGLSVFWLAGYGLLKQGRSAIPIVVGMAVILMYSINWPPFMALAYRVPILNKAVLQQSVLIPAWMLIAAIVALGVDAAITRTSETRRHFLLPCLIALLLMPALIHLDGRVRGILLGALGVIGLILVIRDVPEYRRAIFSLWLVAFVILDVVVLSIRERPCAPAEQFDIHPVARQVLKSPHQSRFWTVSRLSFHDNQVNPLIGMRLDPFLPGTHSPLGYWRVPPTRIARLINLACPGYVEFNDAGKLKGFDNNKTAEEGDITSENLPLLSLMNVGVIFSHWMQLPPVKGLSLTGKEEQLFVYQNQGVLPRAFFVNEVELASDPEKALEMMKPGQLTYSRQAVLEGDFFSPSLSPPSSEALPELFVIKSRPGLWEFQIQGVKLDKEEKARSRHLLLITETRFPGWRAELDGLEVPIYYADYAFMGILIPGGDHSLRLLYKPVEFGLGLFATLSACAFWAFLILVHLIRKGWMKESREQMTG